MSDGALTVLDGTHLADIAPPRPGVALTGAQLLDHADSAVSSSLFGLSLPKSIKSSALHRIGVCHGGDDDEVVFRSSELAPEQASKTIELYIAAIADELKDDPIIVAVLDGRTIRLYLEDEDDFAMLAENLFTDLDEEDKGKIRKAEIGNALVHMGVEMGVPPIKEFPLLNSILKKNGAEGEEELGQAQFASLLQGVLQDLADALAEKSVVLVQNIKIANGSKLRKILADEKQLSNTVEKILQEKQSGEDGSGVAQSVRSYVEKNAFVFGLPAPSEANEPVVLLYDSVFANVEKSKITSGLNKDEFSNLVKTVFEKFAELLEANPVYHDIDN